MRPRAGLRSSLGGESSRTAGDGQRCVCRRGLRGDDTSRTHRRNLVVDARTQQVSVRRFQSRTSATGERRGRWSTPRSCTAWPRSRGTARVLANAPTSRALRRDPTQPATSRNRSYTRGHRPRADSDECSTFRAHLRHPQRQTLHFHASANNPARGRGSCRPIRRSISGRRPIRIRGVLGEARLQLFDTGTKLGVRGQQRFDLRFEPRDPQIPLVLHNHQRSRPDLRVDRRFAPFAQVIDLIEFLARHPQASPMAAP